MKLIRFVHERGLVAHLPADSQSIRDRYGLRPVLVTEARESGDALDVLLSAEGKFLELEASSLYFQAPKNISLLLKKLALGYDVGAVVYHCRQLANAYAAASREFARIRAIPGHPESESGYVSFGYQAVPYYELDALLSAVRRVYDKTAHLAWEAFGGTGGGMPDNIADMLKRCRNVPRDVADRLKSSWDTVGCKVKDYRDCTQHFASTDIGQCTLTMARLDGGVWTTSALIPDNPGVKSKKKFSYASHLDALTYGWGVTSEVVSLATEIWSACSG